MNEEQGRRVGLNEAIFREVNEQIETLNRDFGTEERTMTAVCECADGDCTDRLQISVSAYERVRADPRRFVIIPGHELAEFEAVVESTEEYDIVQKREGGAAELARETDPRS
jgi:5-bromo-4-chloroindolyl phosphate hydrolysis protein